MSADGNLLAAIVICSIKFRSLLAANAIALVLIADYLL